MNASIELPQVGPNPATLAFFAKVLPDRGWYYIATPNPKGKGFIHYPFQTIAAMAAKACELDQQGHNTYFTCASFHEESYVGADGKPHWRTGLNAEWVKCFWLDIDCGVDKASAGKGYATKRAAIMALIKFCEEMGIPEPATVDSGGGVHCYWFFSETIAKNEWLQVAFKFKALAKDGPAKLLADPSRTADIASVLRPVGTHNRKPERGGVEVTLKSDQVPIAYANFRAAVEAAHARLMASKAPLVPGNAAGVGAQEYASIPMEELRDILSHIDPDIERDTWWGILAAVADAYGEAAHGVLRDWSAGILHDRQAVSYDEADYENQFSDALHRPDYGGRRKTLGTVIRLAQHDGWVRNQSMAGAPIPDWLADLNNRYAWIEETASIYRLEYDNFIEPVKFCLQENTRQIAVPSGNGSKSVGIGTAWLREAGRRQHKRLVIRPAEGLITADNCLNLWRGYALQPQPGDIRPFLRLLFRLVPNRAARRYVLKWLTHLIQHPDIKLHVSLAFWSHEQGVGKNLIFECLVSLIGTAHATVISQQDLRSNFNGWANHRVLVIGDEVSSSDKRQDADKLKGLITGTTVRVEEKYQPARECPNLLNFIFLSNHSDALFLDDHDRRFFVWEIVAGRLSQEQAKAFVKWRDAGGLAALLHYLLLHDTSGFDPKAPAPMTTAKSEMVADSRSDLELWLDELMQSNVANTLGREIVTGHELAQRYAHETGRREPPSAKTVVSSCKKLGAYARPHQVRLSVGRKLRALALAQPEIWRERSEAEWAAELVKPLK